MISARSALIVSTIAFSCSFSMSGCGGDEAKAPSAAADCAAESISPLDDDYEKFVDRAAAFAEEQGTERDTGIARELATVCVDANNVSQTISYSDAYDLAKKSLEIP